MIRNSPTLSTRNQAKGNSLPGSACKHWALIRGKRKPGIITSQINMGTPALHRKLWNLRNQAVPCHS